MAASTVVEVPLETRAADLRVRIEADQARAFAITAELADLDEEMGAVTAESIREDPTGDLQETARKKLRELTEQREALAADLRQLDRELPHRGSLLAELEEQIVLAGSAELTADRVAIEERVRQALALVAEQVAAAVESWAGPFVDAVVELSAVHEEAQRRGFDWSAVEPPVGVVPNDVLRLFEMVGGAANLVDAPTAVPHAFVDACGLDGEELRAAVTAAQDRLFSLHHSIPQTSWKSAHV